jgi:hypothetical protein
LEIDPMERANMSKTVKIASLALAFALTAMGQAQGRDDQTGRVLFVAARGGAPDWDRGHWNEGMHDGRMGWWWTVGPSWYWYAQPAYPYPDYPYDPAQSGAEDYVPNQQADVLADDHWYYCDDPKGYYPYVAECRQDAWRIAPIVPSLGARRTAGEPQYYCNDPAGYYPMVADCKRGWRIVPAVAPPR